MTGRRPGRPRSVRAHQAVLQAAAALLAEKGYELLTMEGIAARAGIAKPTLYKWWKSKAAVVAEAVTAELTAADIGPPDTGDLEADLRTWLRDSLGRVGDAMGAASLRGLAAASAESDADAARLIERVLGPAQQAMIARLRCAAERGQVRADADLPAVVDLLFGLVLYRILARSDATGSRDAEALLDLFLRGISSRAPDAAPTVSSDPGDGSDVRPTGAHPSPRSTS